MEAPPRQVVVRGVLEARDLVGAYRASCRRVYVVFGFLAVLLSSRPSSPRRYAATP